MGLWLKWKTALTWVNKIFCCVYIKAETNECLVLSIEPHEWFGGWISRSRRLSDILPPNHECGSMLNTKYELVSAFIPRCIIKRQQQQFIFLRYLPFLYDKQRTISLMPTLRTLRSWHALPTVSFIHCQRDLHYDVTKAVTCHAIVAATFET